MKKFNCILTFSTIIYIIMFSFVSSIKTTGDTLDKKINEYTELLTKVNELKHQIKSTDFISINDMKKIDIEFKNREKILKEKENSKKIIFSSYDFYGTYPLLKKINSFRIENLDIAQKYIFFNNYKYEKIKALYIIKYNLEKKNQLKQIYQEYKSHDKIVEDLTDLYQQKITTII